MLPLGVAAPGNVPGGGGRGDGPAVRRRGRGTRKETFPVGGGARVRPAAERMAAVRAVPVRHDRQGGEKREREPSGCGRGHHGIRRRAGPGAGPASEPGRHRRVRARPGRAGGLARRPRSAPPAPARRGGRPGGAAGGDPRRASGAVVDAGRVRGHRPVRRRDRLDVPAGLRRRRRRPAARPGSGGLQAGRRDVLPHRRRPRPPRTPTRGRSRRPPGRRRAHRRLRRRPRLPGRPGRGPPRRGADRLPRHRRGRGRRPGPVAGHDHRARPLRSLRIPRDHRRRRHPRRPPRTPPGRRRPARHRGRPGVPAAAEADGHRLPRRPGILRHPGPGRHPCRHPHHPGFDAAAAETLVREAVTALDTELPAPAPTDVSPVAAWPPFRLTEDEQPAAALLRAAAEEGLKVRAKTAGPSNIGNLLAGEGIAATAGFGVPYEGLHGIDESAHLAELPRVYGVYRRAVLELLGG